MDEAEDVRSNSLSFLQHLLHLLCWGMRDLGLEPKAPEAFGVLKLAQRGREQCSKRARDDRETNRAMAAA